MSTMEPLSIEVLDDRYARLRITNPGAEHAVQQSMRRLGQLLPIVVCERDGVFAIVDGFKRFVAARTLGLAKLHARVMALSETAAIGALVSLNRHGRGLSDMEEALVVRALCREQGLEQTQVAELLGHHKSWVCRRLALAEQLAPTVAEDVRAGLVSTTVARELVRLPRGNQPDMAAAIRREMLTTREAAQLVTLFAKTSGDAQQKFLLERPREALSAHSASVPMVAHDPRLGPLTQILWQRLHMVMRSMSEVSARFSECMPARWTSTEREVLSPLLDKAISATELLLTTLSETKQAARKSNAA
jgi:ParB/RepB/Spo0J family partition protein